MALRFVILDAIAEATGSAASETSILSLPLGRRTVLAQLVHRAGRLARRAVDEVFVLPAFEPRPEYAEQLAASTGATVRVVNDAQFAECVAAFDDQDSVVVFDAARWPSGLLDVPKILDAYGTQQIPLHVVGASAQNGRARERVEHDEAGKVTRVQRQYQSTDPTVGAGGPPLFSIVPARLLSGLAFDSLNTLRGELSIEGAVSREHLITADVWDLKTTEGVLALVGQVASRQVGIELFEETGGGGRGVVHGDQCSIDPSARVMGPVILHSNVTIEPEATVIGPAVIGAHSVVGRGAVVAQAIVATGTRIAPDVTLRHCIASGACSVSESRDGQQPDPVRLTTFTAPQAPDISRRVQFAVKRTFDIVISALGLLILLPLLIALAIIVKLTSPGPLFFIHRRERADGKEFGCIKFRSMAPGAHAMQAELLGQNEVDGPQFKLRHDPRVTRIGVWMRKLNLDELPQLLNVIAGHMSLVGPRPSPFGENQICVPWRRARLSVRPGITGLWQICRSADRTAGDFHEWIYYDMTYVRHFSLWLDFKILVATVLTLGGRYSVPLPKLLPSAPVDTEPRQTVVT